jgi:triacylglycerol esterase/lipase EstA (alpha/beta hydrolase family)
MGRIRAAAVFLCVLITLVCTGGVPASAGAPAGPALGVSEDQLQAALSCPPAFSHPDHNPVLLVHGTTQTAQETWGWNYWKILPTLGYDTCAVTLPNRSLDDMQISTEYVVHAIRTMAAESATGRVDVIGHSQGVEELRWAVRWWPDVAKDVQRLIGLAGPDHGTSVFDGMCDVPCWASAWQERTDAQFMAALNTEPAIPGIDYSMIYTLTDQFVEPESSTPLGTGPTSGVGAGTTVAVQDLCPGRPVDHIGMVGDAVVFALVQDALTSGDGIAHPERIPSGVCAQTTAPGVNAADEAAMDATLYTMTVPGAYQQDRVDAEPPLQPYATRPGQPTG